MVAESQKSRDNVAGPNGERSNNQMTKPKKQRVRDPIHNLIEFSHSEFEHTLWQAIQTPPFQRLRRIKQLGFSELVFPGATHTRFAHSLGVFHTARQLVDVIREYVVEHDHQFRESQAQHAMAAALLHDVGHGMFSHAFEQIGKYYGWELAKHELVSQRIIKETEISHVLDSLGIGYAANVADVIAHEMPVNLYGSVVSSQFDADRLDYMQRDRFMTGVQSSGVDPTWLLANLEIAQVETGSDETGTGTIETLVLGPKAVQTAESYVLSLFHLYPNVYLHKATRAAELIFTDLFHNLVRLHRSEGEKKSNLAPNHPLFKFMEDPTSLDRALALDDAALWGAIPMLIEAEDPAVCKLALSLSHRTLTRCFDVRQFAEANVARSQDENHVQRQERMARITLICDEVASTLREENCSPGDGCARFLIDQYVRHPYKRFQDSKTPLNQILIRLGETAPRDMADLSPVIRNAESFHICRVYTFRDDMQASGMIEDITRTKIREACDA